MVEEILYGRIVSNETAEQLQGVFIDNDTFFNFVKDINDFCRDRLYLKEKFLRKNWQEYLPNDRGSLYSVCMKHLSIPERSNPREIWGRVIVPSIRDKFQRA